MVIKNKALQNDRSFPQIEQIAIDHALSGRWKEAVKLNLDGTTNFPENIG